MNANQQIELKLVEAYDQELTDLFYEKGKEVVREKSVQHYLKAVQRQVDIFERQVRNYKCLFPTDVAIQDYEARVYFFQGMFQVFSGTYHESPSELYKAIALFDKSLQISERFNTRNMKVLCYRRLNDKKSALQELNCILERYVDDQEAYLQARKEKDELETPSSSGIGRLFRSLFG